VLLAGTNDHLILNEDQRLIYVPEPRDLSFRPSVDVFFGSVAGLWPRPGIAVLLTGIGRDGADGLLELRRMGWHTIAQDQATSVIWGMPRAASEIGAAVEVLPLAKIAPAVIERHRSAAMVSKES
jgi:two-component system response regulator WspF